jgi:hypothetical protein
MNSMFTGTSDVVIARPDGTAAALGTLERIGRRAGRP